MPAQVNIRLTYVEKRNLERELGMESGYVLNFTNRTFEEFFRDIVGVDIFDAKFGLRSGSKANRMRAFWDFASTEQLKLLFQGLIDVWEIHSDSSMPQSAHALLEQLVAKFSVSSGGDSHVRHSENQRPFFHFLVASSKGEWDHGTKSFPADRCLNSNEYTSPLLAEKYGGLTREDIELLIQVPAVFAYESPLNLDARVGRIRDVSIDHETVTLNFEMINTYPPVSNETLFNLRDHLGIEDNEFYRGHWAIKPHNLSSVLSEQGFPSVPFSPQPLINIRQHSFLVSLSFPGEVRNYVEEVANHLVRVLGSNSVFYDNFYKSQLAVPNLDTVLQGLYRNQSRLIVVFLSANYESKEWCGVEFRAIRDIIKSKKNEMVMLVRLDNSPVEGVFSIDGYIDANSYSPSDLGMLIHERVQLRP